MRVWKAWATAACLALWACGAPQTTAPAEPALWRVSDADSVIWLYGTVHLLPADLRWRGPKFEQAFASSGELVMEVDPATLTPDRMRQLTTRYGMLPPGETLASRLDQPAREALARIEADLHLDPAALEPMRPWLAAQQLAVADAIRDGVHTEGVEFALDADANRRHMGRSYLESAEQQILTLADLPQADETHFLVATLGQIERETGGEDEALQAWARGDVATLTRLLEAEGHDAGPAAYDALIAHRNAVWADEISRRLNGSGHIFIAVGAAHLLGPEGVVALLRARGIHVDGP